MAVNRALVTQLNATTGALLQQFTLAANTTSATSFALAPSGSLLLYSISNAATLLAYNLEARVRGVWPWAGTRQSAVRTKATMGRKYDMESPVIGSRLGLLEGKD